MVKPTIAKLLSVSITLNMHFFSTEGYHFYVKKLDNGILVIEPDTFSSIHHITEIVAGCFSPSSTFKDVKKVIFTFNGKKVSVKKEENATPAMIYQKWKDTPYK